MKRKKGNKLREKRALQAAAHSLLGDETFLRRVVRKLRESGVVGERKNILILVLAAVTRILAPVSCLLKGPSSSGKNNVVRNVVSLLPPESVIFRASLTAKAMAYGSEDLTAKVFYLYEYRGGHDAQFLTRLLQSEGSLEHEHTVVRGSDRGTLVARRTGSPVVLTTTTEDRVCEDDETRFLSLRADDSPDLTRAVLIPKFRQSEIENPQPPIEVWHEAFRLLSKCVPEFTYLSWLEFVAKKIPAGETRARRDTDRFLSLLKAVALIRSFSDGRRDSCGRGPIEISIADYAVAFEILNDTFESSYRGVHTQALKIADAVCLLGRTWGRPVTVKEVATELSWKEATTYKWLKVATKHKLVALKDGTNPKNLKLLIAGPNPSTGFLPNPLLVLKENPKLGDSIRYVSALTGEPVVLSRHRGSRPSK